MAQAELEGSSVLSQFRVDSDSEEDAGGHQVGGFADLRIKSEMVDDEPEFHGFTDSEIPAWVVDNFEDQDLKTGFSFNPTMFMSIVRSNKVTSSKQPPNEATPPNLMAVNIKTVSKRNVEPNLGLDDPARQEKSPRVSVIKLHRSSTIRNSAALGIPRADIEVEMLSYTAKKNVKAEMEKRDSESADTGETAETAPEPSSDDGGVMHEVRVKTETSGLEKDLELSLDKVDSELFADAQSMLGDTTMSEDVPAVKAEQPVALPLARALTRSQTKQEAFATLALNPPRVLLPGRGRAGVSRGAGLF